MLIPFSPPPGLNSDDTAFTSEGRWADCSNVRFVDGKPQVVGEFIKVFASALTGDIRHFFPFTRSSAISVAYGTASKLYVGSGISAPSDRTPGGIGSSIEFWSFAAWGSTLLASPGSGKLFEQSGSGTATEVTNAPDVITHMLVTPQRQVIALGCNEEVSGTFNGLCIRGSDLEDYTDWTTTATNNAFEHILEGAGLIVAGRMVGDYLAVWTDNALYLGQFIGDPGQTYRFDRVDGNCGLIGPKAVAIMNGVAYWLAKDLRLRAWAPGGLPQIMPCPIYRDTFADLNPTPSQRARLTLCGVTKFNEIWINFPSSGGYAAVNVQDGTWFKGDFTRQAMVCSDLLQNADPNGAFASNVWAADGSHIYAHECGFDQSEAGPASWHITSADQYFDNSQRRMMVRSFIPDFETVAGTPNDGEVSLTLYVRDRPQSTAVTKGPYPIAASASKKDFRASGKIIAVKLSQSPSLGSNRELRIGKLLFDVVPLGER